MKRCLTSSAFAVLATLPSLPLFAQTATVAVAEENFRAEPGGEVIARLYEGARLVLGETRDRWRQATVEAWIWNRSVGPYGQEVIVNAGGENLRESPNGARVGRAEGGMRIEPVERDGDWLRVRRTAWIWAPSLDVTAADGAAPAPTLVPADTEPAAVPARTAREFATVSGGGAVLDQPGGDSIARLRPGAGVEVLAREGDWTRIRVEGWAHTADFTEHAAAAVLVDIGRDSLQEHPEAFRGRMVEWTVQVISLQEAEAFRSGFVEGEPFILARRPADDAGFVYVAVPEELREAVEALSPLQRIRILARVRSVRSALTDAPIVELRAILR